MPAKSRAQQRMIFARRKQYGSREKTPKNWRWIWDPGYEELEEGAPERVHNESRFEEYLSKAYEESAMAHSYRMDELASEKYKLMREFGTKTKEAAQRFLNAMGLEKELVNKIVELFTK